MQMQKGNDARSRQRGEDRRLEKGERKRLKEGREVCITEGGANSVMKDCKAGGGIERARLAF